MLIPVVFCLVPDYFRLAAALKLNHTNEIPANLSVHPSVRLCVS